MRPDEPVLEVDDIQGHVLIGFGGGHQSLIGIRFLAAGKVAAKAALLPWIERVTSTRKAIKFRSERRREPMRFATAVRDDVQIAVALSVGGLAELTDDPGPADTQFRQGAARAVVGLHDAVDASGRPVGWVVGDSEATTPHLLVLLAGSEQAVTSTRSELLKDLGGLVQVIYDERGLRLPGDREHFGFADGISQPGVRGSIDGVTPLTARAYPDSDPLSAMYAKPGQPLVWPGQFVYGYPSQQIDSYDPGPVIGSTPLLRNGSLLVFRRLRQNVTAFRNAMAALAAAHTQAGTPTDADTAAALAVGRWPDGTPVSLSPSGPNTKLSGAPVRVNGFLYHSNLPPADLTAAELQLSHADDHFPGAAGDPSGLVCPFFAHIRKVNPRDQPVDQGSSGVTLRSQMLRRGVPYGPRWGAGESDDLPPDRGLLFLSYQTSIENQFNRLMTLWVNSRNAPPPGEGEDAMLSAEPTGGRALTRRTGLTSRIQTLLPGEWITATGAGYFFTPGIRTLKVLLSSGGPIRT